MGWWPIHSSVGPVIAMGKGLAGLACWLSSHGELVLQIRHNVQNSAFGTCSILSYLFRPYQLRVGSELEVICNDSNSTLLLSLLSWLLTA